MQDKNIGALAQKFLRNEASEEEIRQLMEWYNDFSEEELTVTITAQENDSVSALKHRMLHRLKTSLQKPELPLAPTAKPVAASTKKILRVAVAAVSAGLIFILAQTMIFKQTPDTENKNAVYSSVKQEDIVPGSAKALLTLSDGSTIVLDTLNNGLVSTQGHIQIIKQAVGQLSYEPENSENTITNILAFNTVTTPMGGQYQLTLADGSKVWLNAGSSIRFPALFSTHHRAVEITGEVYFEIAPLLAKDGSGKKVPFVVKVEPSGTEVNVLGTHFNINAYGDEPVIATTLLEGSISLETKGRYHQTEILKPGQQSRTLRDGEGKNAIHMLDQASLENVIAWKNQAFRFENADLPSIMRQIARWYNVEIVYQDNVSEEYFSGAIPRYAGVKDVLTKLELTQTVRFDIQGRKITVNAVRGKNK